jgi:O-antigen/teichoic acid export membrane protein
LLLRSTLIYAPAILLTRISALLLLALATRLVDQTEYGLLTLVVTLGEMTDLAVTNWLRISLLRLGGKGDVSRGSVMLAAKVLVVTTALALCVSTVASTFLVPERAAEFALAVCAYLVAGAVGRLALTVLQMQQRHSSYSMLEFLRAVLQLVLPLASLLVVGASFLSLSLASSLGTLIAGLAAWGMARRWIVAGPARFTVGEFFGLGLPLIVMALLGFGLNNAERVFLKVYYDAGAVAVFAAAYALARQPIDMVANAINMGAFPEVVSRFDDEGPSAAGQVLSRLLALMARLCLPVAALLIVLRNDITGLLLPGEYHGESGGLFPIIAFSVLCANLTSFVYGVVVHAHKRPWLLSIANAAGSVATVACSFLLIPPMGAYGAAFALAAGSLVGLITCVAISERLMPVPVPWRDIGMSCLVAMAVGLAAWLAGAALPQAPSLLRLLAGGLCGGGLFLALNAMLYPEATLGLLRRVRSRIVHAS